MKVFLSHSSSDKKSVKRLASDLRAHGIDVWFDAYEIRLGDVIVQKLQDGIEKCDFVVVWLTKKATQSHWVQREWYTKFHDEIESARTMVLPLLADNCNIPAFLRGKRYADFRNDYYSGLKELLAFFDIEPVQNVQIVIETPNPVYWSLVGCPITVHISSDSVSRGNKFVVFQRNIGEEENKWHFQYERRIDSINMTCSPRVWFGALRKGNLETHEVLVAIVPKERKYLRDPFSAKVDFEDFIAYEGITVTRDDADAKRGSNRLMDTDTN